MRGLTPCDFRTYDVADLLGTDYVISGEGQVHQSMEQKGEPRNSPMQLQPTDILTQVQKQFSSLSNRMF